MFSRREKPVGKRPPSTISSRSHTSDDSAPSGRGSRLDDRFDAAPARPVFVPTPRPLALPSIPRVASQYGAHGPVNMSELERKLMNFELEERRSSPVRSAQSGPIAPLRASKTHLETIQDTEAQLTGASLPKPSPQTTAPQTSPQARISSSNFSRPRQFQSPPLPVNPPAQTRPINEPQTQFNASRMQDATVRLVPQNEPPVPTQGGHFSPDPTALVSSSIRDFPSSWTPHPPATQSLSPVDMDFTPSSTVPPPPLRKPPPPPSAQTVPIPVRPKTAPSEPAATTSDFQSFQVVPAGSGARSSTRGIRPLRRSTEESPPQLNRTAPPPLSIHPAPLQSAAPTPGVASMRPTPTNWPSTESAASTVTPSAEGPSTKPSKTVRSRFNPISLITRRKTGQTSRPPPSEPFSPPHTLPADFDPRIRGSVVHDFSAPRPRPTTTGPSPHMTNFPPRTTSIHQGIRPVQDAESLSKTKSPPAETPRAPVFTEDFSDDTDSWRLNEKDRRNQDSTGIADRVPEQLPEETVSSMPVFARRPPPSALALGPAAPPPSGPLPPTPQAPIPIVRTEVAPPSLEDAIEPTPKPLSTPPAPQTPPAPSRSPSMSGSGGLLAPTPARLKSNASSRFSFDLAGVGSTAQEKLLEEKHRQRTAQKARESTVSGMSVVETDDEDNGYDDSVGFDDFEDDIPDMNSDDDDEFPQMGKVSDFVLPPRNVPDAPTAPGLQNSWNLSQPLESLAAKEPEESIGSADPPAELTHPGDNVPTEPTSNQAYQDQLQQMELQMQNQSFIDDYEEDDFYFDDGDIETGDGGDEPFNESVFDDAGNTRYGAPLRDQPKQPTAQPDTLPSDSSQQSTRPMSLDSTLHAPKDARATTDTSRTSVQPANAGAPAHKQPVLDTIPQKGDVNTASLTQDNLAAYHDALAYAANKAAIEGRFDRKMSVDESSSDADLKQHRPHVSFTESQPLPLTEENVLDFDFDDLDDMDDDDVIAAANAEALENDDEGIYGSEFGFYANGGGNGAERVHGGYFGGSSFNDMVKRSHSGRNKDPSLTPITERSEWSQRNSMISLALQSGASDRYSAAHTPGLAQLADSLQYEGSTDDMSLSALMKLRRGAFGDSTTSLPSSAGSHKSASPSGGFVFPQPPTLGPVPHTAPLPANGAAPNNPSMGPPPDLPPRMQPFVGSGIPLLSPSAPPTASGIYAPDRGANPSPHRRPVSKLPTHSRNSSGAESVTYTKERDEESGHGRWVMERKRTSDAGEVEILGRQVLEGQI